MSVVAGAGVSDEAGDLLDADAGGWHQGANEWLSPRRVQLIPMSLAVHMGRNSCPMLAASKAVPDLVAKRRSWSLCRVLASRRSAACCCLRARSA
jgi:hypothetical protein